MPQQAVVIDRSHPQMDMREHQVWPGLLRPTTLEGFSANPAADDVARRQTLASRHTTTSSGGQRVSVKMCSKEAGLEAHVALLVEARLLHALSRHPQILELVAVVGVPQPLLLTPRMAGGQLNVYLRQQTSAGALETADLVAVCSQVASAMAYLESLAIVHRSLSPECVLVGSGLQDVRLTGFGERWTMGIDGVLSLRPSP